MYDLLVYLSGIASGIVVGRFLLPSIPSYLLTMDDLHLEATNLEDMLKLIELAFKHKHTFKKVKSENVADGPCIK